MCEKGMPPYCNIQSLLNKKCRGKKESCRHSKYDLGH